MTSSSASRSTGPSPAKKAGPSPRRRPSLILILLVLALGFVIGRACDGPPAASTETPAEQATTWTCSMHPQIRLPEPGSCPICFMDLIPVNTGDDEDLGPGVLSLSPQAAALAGVRTAPVERRAVSRSLRLFGRVSHDETRVDTITAWVSGRLDKLFVDYVGAQVRAGDHLGEIYSPNLLTTQRELLGAVEAVRVYEERGEEVPNRQQASLDVARERMRLWGLKDEQIADIEAQTEPSTHITIHTQTAGTVIEKPVAEGTYVNTGDHIYTIADLSHVWLMLDAYEPDLPWIRFGQHVSFEVDAYPGEVLHGSVAFIAPILDEATRTVRVRVNVDNPDGRLRPGMFVRAKVEAALGDGGRVLEPDLAGTWMCPMHPEILADEATDCELCGMALVPAASLGYRAAQPGPDPLVIPASAPLVTGKRAVVFVQHIEAERPTFELREIVLGPRAGDEYVVVDGLEEGERVVAHGAFKIDAELQLRGQPSMMSPAAADGAGAAPAMLETPEGFRDTLSVAVAAYLDIHSALAADDLAAAQTAARRFRTQLAAVDAEGLSEEAAALWGEQSSVARLQSAGVARATEPDLARTAFGALSVAMVETTEAFGHGQASAELAVYHCPMALDDAGADWLQAVGTTANPYYGSAMLRCGDQVRALHRAA